MKNVKASYDVTLSPKVNVVVSVADPFKPTESEIEVIVKKAISSIHENADDVLVADNLEAVELYSVGNDVSGILSSPERIYPGRPGALDTMKRALAELENMTTSGYIPFASPAPSSTEKALKYAFEDALKSLSSAIAIHKMLYGDGQTAGIDK